MTPEEMAKPFMAAINHPMFKPVITKEIMLHLQLGDEHYDEILKHVRNTRLIVKTKKEQQ